MGKTVKPLAVVLALAIAQPAFACHRFSRWLYPYPQRCGVKSKPTVERVTIEITITPELLETWARQDAIEKLKAAR
jgi:hypothetical protein